MPQIQKPAASPGKKANTDAVKRGGQPGNANAVTHGAYSTKSAVQLRQRRLRHRVNRLRRDYPHLKEQPRHLVLRYVEVDYLSAELWARLAEDGPIGRDGEPRRLLTEYRYLLAELGRLAATLGLTAQADGDAGGFPL